MSGKPVEYWRKKFDAKISESNSKFNNAKDLTLPEWFKYLSAFSLLCEYSGTKKSAYFGMYGGGFWSRVLEGRWGTSHGNEVRLALEIVDKLPIKEQTVINLIYAVSDNLSKKTLKKDGDLNRILYVIKEKTGVSFENCETSPRIK